MEAHADYDGPALTWGLTYKKASAAQCCQACKEVRGRLRGDGRWWVAAQRQLWPEVLWMAQDSVAFSSALPLLQFQPQPDGQRCNVWVSCGGCAARMSGC